LRYTSGPGTVFIDFFNDNLMPGIGMSGGYKISLLDENQGAKY
jgi:hypothetical protein